MTTEVPIRYRSLAGPIYDGRLLEVLGNGRATIEVDAGAKDRVSITMVRWRKSDDGFRYTAWPKAGEADKPATAPMSDCALVPD